MPAAAWIRVALSPRPDDVEVQNGMAVLPAKSFSVTRRLMGQAVMPRQMG